MTTDSGAAAALTIVSSLLEASIRAAVLASVMALALAALRVKTAGRLHAWTMVLCAALAMPVLMSVAPAWHWRLPDLQWLRGWTAAATSSSLASGITVTVRGTGGAAPLWTAAWPSAALVVYLAGVFVLAARVAIAWRTSARLRRSTRRIDDAELTARLERHSARAGLKRTPALLESPRVFVPLTMSVTSPAIALPSDWPSWPAGRLDAVLAHEVAHIARRDLVAQRLSLVYRIVFWCNPLSWWLHRHLHDLAERASDEAALASGAEPASYAELLLEFFTKVQHMPRRADWHAAMARGADRDAGRRIARVLSWKGGPTVKRTKLLIIVASLVVVGTAALVAAIRPMTTVSASELPTLTPVMAVAVTPQDPPPPPPPPPPPAKRIKPEMPPPPPPPPPKPAKYVLQNVHDDFAEGAYGLDAPGLVAPLLRTRVDPKYTSDAMRAKIQGDVIVEIVVNADGDVSKARVATSLDKTYGLDDEALKAVRQWHFDPATVNGRAMPVVFKVALVFRLH